MFRRSRNSYFEVERPRVEVIPMIDIMMFLLVFFVVLSVNMIAGTGVDMNLPGSKTTADIKEATITVGVKKDNQFIVDGELETLINVMDSVRGAGINSVGIAAIAASQ